MQRHTLKHNQIHLSLPHHFCGGIQMLNAHQFLLSLYKGSWCDSVSFPVKTYYHILQDGCATYLTYFHLPDGENGRISFRLHHRFLYSVELI